MVLRRTVCSEAVERSVGRTALLKSIAEAQEISEEVEAELKEAIAAFKGDFVVRHGLAAEEPEAAEEEEALAARGLEEEAAS